MKPIRKILLIFASLFLLSSISAQEESEVPADISSSEETAKSIQPADFVLQFEPGIYINTESKLVSAPSPVVYPISVGFLWPEHSVFAIQPTLSFFMMHHLLYEDKALPAEIENRTTTTLSFMLNIPAVYSIYLSNSNFQITAGLGIFMRFGILSPGVKEGDSGWSGSAGSDVKKINSYFWGNLRWLYLTLGGSWLYNLTPQLKAGPTLNIYLPAGGLISDGSAQALLISAGIKICR
ncbi:hypothetical protein SAMN04487977_10315 [Treponema bryantii]|uniref:Outer membrane protein beta-barrel domain-containing protein n=1 Tax=Treponema bryantii TaxID=163 RepID=A0A1H9E4C4_9SPIR|nr:hypothetical protein [Treponema bryantii]SEQ20531.1 hypothetical protein SAMN04487977_10315 [Treponema bryantii]